MKASKHLGHILLLMLGLTSRCLPSYAAVDPMDPILVKARIKPVGQVNIAGVNSLPPAVTVQPATRKLVLASGEAIYNAKCVVCHATGLAGAPKLADQNAWKPRLAQGMSVLLQHVKHGYKAMPPKGTCLECSDTDLQAAISYLIKGSN